MKSLIMLEPAANGISLPKTSGPSMVGWAQAKADDSINERVNKLNGNFMASEIDKGTVMFNHVHILY